MCTKNSIKASEWRLRMTVEGIETIISGSDQPLLQKLIDSGLFQRLRQHCNNSSQSGHSLRLKVNNLINRYS